MKHYSKRYKMRLSKKLKLIFKAAAVFLSAAAGFLVWLCTDKWIAAYRKKKQRLNKADSKKAECFETIKNTDSSMLVDAADNADELHAIAAGIKQNTTEAIQNRIRQSGL